MKEKNIGGIVGIMNTNKLAISFVSTTALIIMCSLMILNTTPTNTIKDMFYQYEEVITASTQSSELYMNVSSVSFDDADMGCVFINVSGRMNDVEVIRFNVTWDSKIFSIISIDYNTDMWPMVLNEESNSQKGYATAHLFNITNAYGIDIDGEIECVRIFFKAVDTLNTDSCCDLVLVEHEVTTGDHEDIVCASSKGVLCVVTIGGSVIKDEDSGPDMDQNESKDMSSVYIFITLIFIVMVLGIFAIIKIIKK
jgi:hypothetical protein